MNRLKGIWVPVLSPQKEDCSIDMDRLFDHIDWLFGHQIHGIVLFGTNGEATSFSVAERKAVLERIRNKGIQNEKVMVGTGCSALTDTVDLSIHALALGYAHQLILPPFYYKQPTQEGLINNYSEIIQRVGQDHYLSMQKDGTDVKLHELWSNEPWVDVKAKYPEITRSYSKRLKGIYETAKYMLYHNKN